MKIAYLSPLTPERSGIADFSEELVQKLNNYVDIDLFYNDIPDNPDIFWKFTCIPIEEFDRQEIRDQYDLFVYQLGNNIDFHRKIMEYALKYPGIIEVHDFCMCDAVILFCKSKEACLDWVLKSDGEEARAKLDYFYTNGGLPPWQADPWQMPMLRPFVEKSKAVIVHTKKNKKRIQKLCNDALIKNIALHTSEIADDIELLKKQARKRLNISEDIMMFGSFGQASASKRVKEIVKALGRYKKEFPNDVFYYYIVGEVVKEVGISECIVENNLSENVKICGHVSLVQFEEYMKACDFCLNLRYPYRGETSGSLHRMLGYGKMAFVTDIDSFSDYPDSCTIKIPYGEKECDALYQELKKVLQGGTNYQKMGRNAWEYAKKNLDLDNNTKEYYAFFRQFIDMEEKIKEIIDQAYDVELREIGYRTHLMKKMKWFEDQYSIE